MSDERLETAVRGGARITDRRVRRLHDLLCEELVLLSASVEVDAAPFETRFSMNGRQFARLSPYRELVLVSAGCDPVCEVRVTGDEGLMRALDLAVESFLHALEGGPPV
jgi:hypothetical protein